MLRSSTGIKIKSGTTVGSTVTGLNNQNHQNTERWSRYSNNSVKIDTNSTQETSSTEWTHKAHLNSNLPLKIFRSIQNNDALIFCAIPAQCPAQNRPLNVYRWRSNLHNSSSLSSSWYPAQSLHQAQSSHPVFPTSPVFASSLRIKSTNPTYSFQYSFHSLCTIFSLYIY